MQKVHCTIPIFFKTKLKFKVKKLQSIWETFPCLLLQKGMLQMFRLGEFLRTRYNGYLSELYSPNDFLMKSSANDRCLMSAQVVLAGLYPPTGSQVWNPDLKWQPIPVHSTPRHLDQVI
jgi:hypothetical protein